MRKPIIGGNWKMHRGIPVEAAEMIETLIPLIKEVKNVDCVICPPFTTISTVSELIKGTNIKLGSQNMYFEDSGPFTGEIAPNFIKSLGCKYVILGHSERRDIFQESDELVNKKIKKALSVNLKPIVCIGEHLVDREAGRAKFMVKFRLDNTLTGLDKEDILKIVIAYEPIWAIGTGKTATPEQAEEVHIYIRQILADRYDQETADLVRIQYGGSIKPTNAEELFKMNNIDGGLVGGASLEADSFSEIIKAAEKISN